MAITEDASAPAVKETTGTTDPTTASFTPPDNSLLVALVGALGDNGGIDETVAVSDSTGGVWTKAVEQLTHGTWRGAASVYYRYCYVSPGAMTFSAVFTRSTSGGYIAMKVLLGCDPKQNGASASAELANSTANPDYQATVTTTTTGAHVYGIVACTRSDVHPLADANTTLIDGYDDATDHTSASSIKATVDVATPGATTLGATQNIGAGSNEGACSLFEVQPRLVRGVDTHTQAINRSSRW